LSRVRIERRLIDRAEFRDVHGENGFQHRGEVLHQMSGKEIALLRSPPLRTGHDVE